MSNKFDWSVFQNTNSFMKLYEKQNGEQTNEWWVKRLTEIVEMIPDRENWNKRWWWLMHLMRYKKISRLMRKQNRIEKIKEGVIMGLFRKGEKQEDREIRVSIENYQVKIQGKRASMVNDDSIKIVLGEIYSIQNLKLHPGYEIFWNAKTGFSLGIFNNDFQYQVLEIKKQVESRIYTSYYYDRDWGFPDGNIMDFAIVNPEKWGFDLVFADKDFNSTHHITFVDFTENRIKDILALVEKCLATNKK